MGLAPILLPTHGFSLGRGMRTKNKGGDMTFKEWAQQNPHTFGLSATEMALLEIGWMAAKVDEANTRLDEALHREAA